MVREGKWFLLSLVLFVSVTGCARQKELERVNSEQAATIVSLNDDLAKLNEQLSALNKAKDDLAKTRADLEKRLKDELVGGDITLSMQDRGLVLTVLDRVLFDSGKASIKETAMQTLDKVSDIINRDTKEHIIYVDGHTDDEPIRYSGWKSNWELSTARATEVIHYLVESGSMNPKKLVASGYGEYHPVAVNDNEEGKQKNRRVEIVISPRKYTERKVEKIPAKTTSPKTAVTESVIK